MNWKKENDVVIFEMGMKIKFDFPIKRILEMDDAFFIELELSDEHEDNYFCISKKDGSVKWKEKKNNIHFFKYPLERYQGVHQRCVMDWAKENNILVLGRERRISFDCPINCILETMGIVIVLLEVPSKKSMTENVFGISSDGNILWQIERIPATSTNPTNCYTNVGESGVPGIFVAFNWNCTNVYADVLTGKVIDTEFTK